MGDEHLCEVCFAPSVDHDLETDIGAVWPPLCCRGCPCGSHEQAFVSAWALVEERRTGVKLDVTLTWDHVVAIQAGNPKPA